MSILFSDPVTAYYIPTAQGTDSLTNDNRLAVQPKSSQNVAQSEFPSMEICGESAHEATRRIIELRYHDSDVKPSVSQQTLEDFVTVQKVETHPVPGVEGMTWCILSCQSPPDQDSQSRYIAALDYAMLEGFDAVVIEPFDLTQRTHQWINIMTLVWNVFGCYLSVSVAATLSSRMSDPAMTFAGIVNVVLLQKYVKFVMGDPISQYRNLDFLSDEDMDRVFHMSELLAVRGAFTNVIIKDTRRERYRYNILKYMTAFQLALCAYKYFFGMALSTFFPNRPL